VRDAAKRSLSDLGLEYFDLYLIHFPIAQIYVDPALRYPSGWLDEKNQQAVQVAVPLAETWAAMEALVDEGLAKNIGISNFQGSLVMDLLRSARIKPSVLQIEHHPYLVQSELLALCAENNIAVTAYFSFGPTSYQELDRVMHAQNAANKISGKEDLFDISTFSTASNRANSAPQLLENDMIGAIAKKHGRTNAQVLLRWATQRGIAVIPKSANAQRLKQNLECCSFDLAEEEIKAISGLDMGLRFNNPSDMIKQFHIFA
jgi:D-xylose reductase